MTAQIKELDINTNLELLGMFDELISDGKEDLQTTSSVLEAGFDAAKSEDNKKELTKIINKILREKVNNLNILQLSGYLYISRMEENNKRKIGIMV